MRQHVLVPFLIDFTFIKETSLNTPSYDIPLTLVYTLYESSHEFWTLFRMGPSTVESAQRALSNEPKLFIGPNMSSNENLATHNI